MARSTSRTVWIIAAAAAVVVLAVSVAVIVVQLGSDPPTQPVPTTESTTTTTTSVEPPTTDPDDTTTTTTPADVEETDVTVNVGTEARRYLQVAPRDISPDERLPVVVALHGLGVNAQATSRVADWRHAVEDRRFIALFPQGIADSWNMGPCCPPANLIGVDDGGFLDAVVAEMRDRADVDDERMYLTGFSNGGVMAYAYACERPGVFAAIAPLAGSNITDCFPSEPVSLLHQHSDPDLVVPYDGGPSLGRLLSSRDFPAVPRSVATWAERAGCNTEPTSRTDDDQVEHFEWEGCPDGITVRLTRIPGRGHDWPRKGDFDPLANMLDFFAID